jgi:integrase
VQLDPRSFVSVGESLSTISKNMGHKDVGITSKIYAHVLATTRAESAKNLDRMLG